MKNITHKKKIIEKISIIEKSQKNNSKKQLAEIKAHASATQFYLVPN